jgi:1,4-dihydroxy-2-naphthoyl-CoA synthase
VDAIAVMAVVVLVMVAAYGIGTQHPHMLSCDDFTISGNFAPENCTPGTSTGA